MKITIAADSFKGSLSSIQAGSAIKTGIMRIYPDAEITICAVADGGEGTVDAIFSDGFEKKKVSVHNAAFNVINAEYAVDKSNTAFIEMSAAAGITLIRQEERNPLLTTTYGVGEMINDAVRNGCRDFIIGLGSSATNDGGAGMLQALGFGLVDKDKNSIPLGAQGLEHLCEINTDNVPEELFDCHFTVACDVKNVLCGDNGCSAVYGPQKGADELMIKRMDKYLSRFAHLACTTLGHSCAECEGAGAAGGMGFALMTFLGAKIESGIDLVMRMSGLEEKIASSDIVVTGEGRLDGQSAMGKAVSGVARLAKKYGKKVVAVSGSIADGAKILNSKGVDAYFPAVSRVCTIEEALDYNNSYSNLSDTAEQIFRLIKAFSQ